MQYLVLFLLISSAHAGDTSDTCAMAETSLHTLIGDRVARHSSRRALKERKQIINQRNVQVAKEVVAGRQRNAAIHGVEANLFAGEPKFFTAYRNLQNDDPCTNMHDQLRKQLLATKELIVGQCSKSANRNKKIALSRKLEWDSKYFFQESIYIDSKCVPKINTGELYSMHQLTDGFNASVEKLCQAAWSGLKEVWSRAEVCQGRNGWFAIEEWSQGNIVKRPPPK